MAGAVGDVLIIGPFGFLSQDHSFPHIPNTMFLGDEQNHEVLTLEDARYHVFDLVQGKQHCIKDVLICLGTLECDSQDFSVGYCISVLKTIVRQLLKIGLKRLMLCTPLHRLKPIHVSIEQFFINVTSLQQGILKFVNITPIIQNLSANMFDISHGDSRRHSITNQFSKPLSAADMKFLYLKLRQAMAQVHAAAERLPTWLDIRHGKRKY